jgi:hypothetical protein
LISKIRVVNYKLHQIVYWKRMYINGKNGIMCNSSLLYKNVTLLNILLKYIYVSQSYCRHVLLVFTSRL